MANGFNPFPRLLSMALARGVAPLWILAGALFKLYERNPGNLPMVIRENARRLNIEPAGLLRTLIGLELFAAAVMALIPRLSRAMAVFMLSCFCAILIGEMAMKAQHCGCFGSLPMKPWHMLLIDGTMLAALIVTWAWDRASRGPSDLVNPPRSLLKPALTMIPLLALGLIVSFAVPEPPAKAQRPPVPPTQPDGDTPHPPADPSLNPNPKDIPASWQPPARITDWIGKHWRDIELFQLMPRWPKDLDKGKHYVIFYSRVCDHCLEMFKYDLFVPLDAPVTAVEVPFSPTQMRPADAWDWPETGPMEMLELPLDCHWNIAPTPMVMRLEDGKVTCVQEGEHKKCLGLE